MGIILTAPKLAGSLAEVAFENIAEVFLVFETAALGNVSEGEIGRGNEHLGSVESGVDQKGPDRNAHFLTKSLLKKGSGYTSGSGDVFVGNRFG